MFSAVNSRDAAHDMSGSMLCSILNSSACIDAFGFNSLFKTTAGDFFSDDIDVAEVSDSPELVEEMDDLRTLDLKASRSGMMMSTC